MKRALVLLAVLFFAGAAFAQPAQLAPCLVAGTDCSSGSGVSGLTAGRVVLSTGATTVGDDAGCTWTGTGNSFVGTFGYGVSVGAGTAAAPSVRVGEAGTGLFLAYGNKPTLATGTALSTGFNSFGPVVKAAGQYQFSSTSDPHSTADLALSRASAGTLLVEDGSGNARDVQARTVLGPSTTTTLTESAATSFATLTYSASTVAGAEFLCRIRANDATDFQVLTSRVRISTVRKATGNTVSAVGVVGTDLLAESAGGSTLTCTFTVAEGASAATLQANCVSSLTQTTLNISFLAEAVGPVVIAQL